MAEIVKVHEIRQHCENAVLHHARGFEAQAIGVDLFPKVVNVLPEPHPSFSSVTEHIEIAVAPAHVKKIA